MSLVANTAPHLPYLRRFSRALTGSQKSGDAYVVSVLEALVADPSSFNVDRDPRLELFRAFCRYWNSVGINLTHEELSAEDIDRRARRLDSITPLPRQAFLLMSVEDFTLEETAYILGKSEEETSRLVEQAGREIAQQMATEVLIIEDEPLIAMDIEQMVESLGHRVVGTARTHAEAVTMFAKTRPRMVLADIQLADGSSGIEAVNEILSSTPVPVIFITAFPERLLTGERPEPAFLVTKPFNPDMVKALISQALFFNRHAKAAA